MEPRAAYSLLFIPHFECVTMKKILENMKPYKLMINTYYTVNRRLAVITKLKVNSYCSFPLLHMAAEHHYMTLLRRWINVNHVGSTSQQSRVSMRYYCLDFLQNDSIFN